MSIEQVDIIDGVGIDRKSGNVILTISDHLTWEDAASHFSLLEKKIGRYIDYVRGGQMVEVTPEAASQVVRINIVCKFMPSEIAKRFLNAAASQLEEMNIVFTYELLSSPF